MAEASTQLKLNVLSPERRLLDGKPIHWITLPSSEGAIQVLPGHADMIGTLETGIFTYASVDGKEESGLVTTGFFEVTRDEVTITAEVIELRNEIDLDRAIAAQKKAEAALQENAGDTAAFRKQQLKLQRSLVRQQFARKGML